MALSWAGRLRPDGYIDQTDILSGVGGLSLNAAATEIYYWYQYGWSAGLSSTAVVRLEAASLAQIDRSPDNVPSFSLDPLDAPLLLDETRGLVFVKNKIFDATNLTKVVYTLPGSADANIGADENAYAIAPAQGLLATKNFVYDLNRYDVVATNLVPNPDQLFFDSSGTLWFLSTADGQLKAQKIQR